MAEPCSQHAVLEFFTPSYTQEHLKLALQFYLWLAWIQPLGICSAPLDLKLLYIGQYTLFFVSFLPLKLEGKIGRGAICLRKKKSFFLTKFWTTEILPLESWIYWSSQQGMLERDNHFWSDLASSHSTDNCRYSTVSSTVIYTTVCLLEPFFKCVNTIYVGNHSEIHLLLSKY